jgi:gliding motility-associated-like protein
MNNLPLIFGITMMLCLPARRLSGQEAFICRGNYYLAITDGPALTSVYEVVIHSGTGTVVFDPLPAGSSGADLNGMGYRYSDNYIYGVNAETLELYRVGKDGVAHSLWMLEPNRYLRYVAGDVSPDGRYLVLVGNNSFQDVALVFIDLDSPVYEYRELQLSGPDVRCADIAFDPIDGRLYGFDGIHHRLVTYDINTGEVRSDLPPTSEALLMGGLFFDPFGNLYGYGAIPGENAQKAFYSIDKSTGAVKRETAGPPASRNDGCSCPYTVALRETIEPVEVIPCTEVPVTIEIANISKEPQKGLRLEQNFPESFTIIDIDNPLDGKLTAGGPGAHFFTLDDLSVPLGRHEIIITVELPFNARGAYEFQATLSGLPESLGEVTLSDNPLTLVQQDPTVLNVGELVVNFSEVDTQICSGESIVLDPAIPGASYLWSDGSTEPTFTVTQEGTYSVTVSTGCETVEENLTVNGIGLQLDLGPDLQVELGESVRLHPEVTPSTEGLAYSWTSSASPVTCADCFEPFIEPLSDTWYSLTATDTAGCFVKDSVLVKVIRDRSVFIPNAFSPNGDGINDHFYLQSKRNEMVLDFKVVDRWGNLLFENANFYTNDLSQGWDGRFQGKPLNNGVFYYLASIRFLDGEVTELRGEVEIVR